MLKITSKQLEVTTPIRERIESRLAKLERFDVQLINPHIIITQEKPAFKIEATVKVPQGELFAQAKNEDLYAAINEMGKKLQKQLDKLTHKPEAQRYNNKQILEEKLAEEDEIYEEESVA